jgi:hypothetical protein
MEFTFNLDTVQLDKFNEKFKSSAGKEITEAIKDTAIYGLREAKLQTPVRTGGARNSWKWAFKNSKLANIYSANNYIVSLSEGWKRTRPILPIRAKVLVFQIAKRTAAKSATTTLYKRYQTAIKGLKGKGYSPQEKARIATQQTGVVITNKVTSPAKFKGYKFLDKVAYNTGYFFGNRVGQAIDKVIN